MTVKELLSKLDAKEITEWLAYYKLIQEERGHGPKGKRQTEREMKEVLMGLSPKAKGK